jgi:hypothetical protein
MKHMLTRHLAKTLSELGTPFSLELQFQGRHYFNREVNSNIIEQRKISINMFTYILHE